MSEIHIFQNVEEAITTLNKYSREIKKKNLSKEDIIKKSVSFNIFRAFHNTEKKPSNIYRQWASNNFEFIVEKLNSIKTKKEYDCFLTGLSNSFIGYWASQVSAKNRIIFGPAIKMTNLLIKMLNESFFITNRDILPLMNVPFDLYSLKPLVNIINQLSDVNYKIDIPKNPTMKFIITPDLYWIIQNAVFKLCNEAKIYPIYYDYWCWDEKH